MSETTKMVHVKATCNQVYANKYLKAGDPFPFPIPEHVALSLVKNHYAVIDAAHQTRARPRVERKDLVADDEAEETVAVEEPPVEAEAETEATEEAAESETEATPTRRQRGRYKTRDLKAGE